MSEEFTQFLKTREEAARAYVRGDGTPLESLVSQQGDACFHSPGGDTVTGAGAVAERYRKDATAFRPEGVTHFEVLQQSTSGELGFWTGFQIATAQIGDMPAPMDMKIRVTEVFHKQHGQWKMVHRHADMSKD